MFSPIFCFNYKRDIVIIYDNEMKFFCDMSTKLLQLVALL